MTTVAEIMGMAVKEGDLGIEIETEAEREYLIPIINGWIHKPDGSLRKFGIEYITKNPVKIDRVKEHLKDWKEGLGDIYNRLDKDSISTSVHVHINVQKFSPLQVLNFYLCSVLFEGVLSRYAGPDREGNLFCLRTSDAESCFSQIKEAVKRAKTENDLLNATNPSGQQKLYTNIHTVPVKTLGTIEFRVMRGTTDTKEIRSWVETLYNIREFSTKFETPIDILKYVKERGIENVMREALGEHFDLFFFDGCLKNVSKHLFYVADMASCRKDWDFKPAQTRRPKPQIANPGFAEDGQLIDWDENFEEEDL